MTWLRMAFSLLILVAPVAACAAAPTSSQNFVTVESSDGTPYVFSVEIADMPDEQEKGLMNRTSLDDDAGMLFVFGDEEQRTFWMKNTLIPLDMLFIGKDGMIHHIHHNARPLDETRITSLRPSFAVLEIKGGLADKMGIKEGDKIRHPVFRNDF